MFDINTLKMSRKIFCVGISNKNIDFQIFKNKNVKNVNIKLGIMIYIINIPKLKNYYIQWIS